MILEKVAYPVICEVSQMLQQSVVPKDLAPQDNKL